METSHMDKWKKEREAKRNEEKRRLLAINDADAMDLPLPDRYQRMRYQREIKAHEWLMELRRNIPVPVQPIKRRYAKTNPKAYYED